MRCSCVDAAVLGYLNACRVQLKKFSLKGNKRLFFFFLEAIMLRLGSKLDLPLEAVDEYFALHNLLDRCPDVNVQAALEHFRMVCTNLPVTRERVISARGVLLDAIEKSPNDDVRATWSKAAELVASKAATNVGPTGSYLDRSCYVQSRLHEIVPRLFVGSYRPANDKDLLKSKSITHVCCCINIPARYPNDFKYHVLPAEDVSSFNIRPFFEATFDFIDGAISNGEGVLVHCGAGISRAPTITAAYLMRKLHINAQYALQMIATIRTCACPNIGFRKQLVEYEKELGIPRQL